MRIGHTRINQFNEDAYFPRDIVEQRVGSGRADVGIRTTILLEITADVATSACEQKKQAAQMFSWSFLPL